MVYIDNTVELETQAMKQIEIKRPEGLYETISKVVEFLTDLENHVKLEIPKFLTRIEFTTV